MRRITLFDSSQGRADRPGPPSGTRCTTYRRCGDAHALPNKNNQGSVLVLLILWVIGLMSLMLASLAFDAHIESRITSYYRKRSKADSIARSGMEVARMIMQKRTTLDASGKPQGNQDNTDDRWLVPTQQLASGLPINGLSEPLGDGALILDIVPEPGRRNVNALSEQDWERILEVGEVPVEDWDTLIDSFHDWVDKDDEIYQSGGAERDYYESQDPPRRAKNGPLDTVEELLLVKGFTRTILYGGVLEPADKEEDQVTIPGIVDLLTTYGDGKVNVNAAPKRVLMTLPDVDDYVADIIIEERAPNTDVEQTPGTPPENTSFKSPADFLARVPEAAKTVKVDQISTDSAIYRVTSIGSVGGVERQVFAIVQYDGGKLKILRWREQD